MEQVQIGSVTWTVKTQTPKKDLRERVKEQIRLHPETYNQSTFCGTECCIAGHAGILLGDRSEPHLDAQNWHGRMIAWKAKMADELGVESELFMCGDMWEGTLGEEWDKSVSQEERVEVACRAIDYYAIED